ncbi:MAG: hypothetical protein KY433_11030, partial [Actinobacteria bacterium]|nr:hypothetical protein [Actinomycetota bacterium]
DPGCGQGAPGGGGVSAPGAGALEGVFIDVEVDEALARDAELARRLEEVCPVDIYSEPSAGKLEIVERNVDECVLCRLCLETAHLEVGKGAVRVIKLYDGGASLQ